SREGQLARRLDAPMLGRDRELRRLEESLGRAVAERAAHRATVLGPAGIGKSRLARELARGVDEHASVLTGTCLPYGEGVTFRPLAEIVLAAVGDGDPRAAIKRLVERNKAGDPHAAAIADRVLEAAGLAEA